LLLPAAVAFHWLLLRATFLLLRPATARRIAPRTELARGTAPWREPTPHIDESARHWEKVKEQYHAGFEVPVDDSGGWNCLAAPGLWLFTMFFFRAASQTAAPCYHGRNR